MSELFPQLYSEVISESQGTYGVSSVPGKTQKNVVTYCKENRPSGQNFSSQQKELWSTLPMSARRTFSKHSRPSGMSYDYITSVELIVTLTLQEILIGHV